MEIISDYIDIKDYTTQMAIFATPFVVTGLWYLVRWLFKKPKPDSDTEKEFSARQVSNLLTEQAREIEKKLVEENLENFEVELEKRGNHTGAKKLAEAQEALANNELPKADKLFAEIEAGEELALLKFADVSFARGYIAEEEIRWNDAAQHYTRAAELNPSFDTLIRAQELAHNIGNYNSALSLGMMTKKTAIAEYGEESYQHAMALHLLGASYHEKGQDKKAEFFYQQAIEINKVALGEDHPQTALNMGGLAGVYEGLKRYKDAEFFFKKCLEIVKDRFGDDNTHTASTINNLARLYKKQGNYKDAKRLYQQALNINMKIFGENHPHTATNINNIADIYTAQEKYEEADPLFEKAVKILETVLGDEHPNTKVAIENYEENKKRLANTENPTPQ